MDEMRRKELLAPFPPAAIKKRQGGGGRSFDYVSGGDVIRRVIDATSNDYAWTVTRLEFVSDGKAAFWLCEGKLELTGLGVRHGVGTHQAMDLESPKSAETDAFKRAARLFGVALQLYEDDPPAAPVPVQRPAPQPKQTLSPEAAAAKRFKQARDEAGVIFHPILLERVLNLPEGDGMHRYNDDGKMLLAEFTVAEFAKLIYYCNEQKQQAENAKKVLGGLNHEHEPT